MAAPKTLVLGLVLVGSFLYDGTQAQLAVFGGAAGELGKALNYLRQCREATGTSEQTVQLMLETHQLPDTHEGQCLIACMGDSYGVMRNGKFNPDAAMVAVDTIMKNVGHRDDNLRAEIQRIVNTCSSQGVPSDDPCFNAAALAQCARKESRGLVAARRG